VTAPSLSERLQFLAATVVSQNQREAVAAVTAEIERLLERADIRKHDDKCGRVLWHLHNSEVSVGKAAEWMREYIQTGKEGPLPSLEAVRLAKPAYHEPPYLDGYFGEV
jgi:hypothetical protein